MKILYPNQILFLYRRIVEEMGGEMGLRDRGLLESAVYRVQSSFGGTEKYPDLFSKTAALTHALINNHPFIDGNKRVAYGAMRIILKINGFQLKSSKKARVKLMMDLAKGQISVENLTRWIQKKAKKTL